MSRMLNGTVILAVVCVVGSALLKAEPQPESSNPSHTDIKALQEQRIAVLQERVVGIKFWVDAGRVGASELIRPEIDVINARLEYAESNIERKNLLRSLLVKYDQLIEVAELRAEPRLKPDLSNRRSVLQAGSELLFLKSERIRIQILHDTQPSK